MPPSSRASWISTRADRSARSDSAARFLRGGCELCVGASPALRRARLLVPGGLLLLAVPVAIEVSPLAAAGPLIAALLLRAELRALDAAGWRLQARGDHWRWRGPGGAGRGQLHCRARLDALLWLVLEAEEFGEGRELLIARSALTGSDWSLLRRALLLAESR